MNRPCASEGPSLGVGCAPSYLVVATFNDGRNQNGWRERLTHIYLTSILRCGSKRGLSRHVLHKLAHPNSEPLTGGYRPFRGQ